MSISSFDTDVRDWRVAPSEAPRVRRGVIARALGTTDSVGPTILRLGLGTVMLIHGLQKTAGILGGAGFDASVRYMTVGLALPRWLAVAALVVELSAAAALILGFLTRFASLGIAAILGGAMLLVHWSHGFFMNWTGRQAGEGFEYHLLGLTLAFGLMALGGGGASVDHWITTRGTRRRAARDSSPVYGRAVSAPSFVPTRVSPEPVSTAPFPPAPRMPEAPPRVAPNVSPRTAANESGFPSPSIPSSPGRTMPPNGATPSTPAGSRAGEAPAFPSDAYGVRKP